MEALIGVTVDKREVLLLNINETLRPGTSCGYTGYVMWVHRVRHVGTQGTSCGYTGYVMWVHRVRHVGAQGTSCGGTEYITHILCLHVHLQLFSPGIEHHKKQHCLLLK